MVYITHPGTNPLVRLPRSLSSWLSVSRTHALQFGVVREFVVPNDEEKDDRKFFER